MAKVKKQQTPLDPEALTVAQLAMVDTLPEEFKAKVVESLKASNRATRAGVIKNRNEFSAVKNINGNIVIRGLGNRWPLGIRPDSLKTLLDHADELRKLC